MNAYSFDKNKGIIAQLAARLLVGVYLSLALTALYQSLLAAYGRVDPGAILLRMPSWVCNTNALAPLMIAGILLGLHIRSGPVIALCAVAGALSLSITTLAAALIALLIITRSWRWGLTLAALLLAVVIVRWADLARMTSITHRLTLWGMAWRAFLEYPLTGTSAPWYIFAHGTGVIAVYTHYHSLYLQMLATAGIVGLIALVVLGGSLALAVGGSKRAAFLLIFLAIHGLGDYVYWVPFVAIFMVATLCLLALPAPRLSFSAEGIAVLIVVGWLVYDRVSAWGLTAAGAMLFGLLFSLALSVCVSPWFATSKVTMLEHRRVWR
jgi:hypothetical protein